jgi:hypothetical protein
LISNHLFSHWIFAASTPPRIYLLKQSSVSSGAWLVNPDIGNTKRRCRNARHDERPRDSSCRITHDSSKCTCRTRPPSPVGGSESRLFNLRTAPRGHSPEWSGEVDVVSEACLAGTVQQPKQRDTLLAAASAPDDNDDAVVWLGRCRMQKIVPVAGEQYAAGLMGKPKHCLVGGIARKGFTQQRDVVAEFLQQVLRSSGTS